MPFFIARRTGGQSYNSFYTVGHFKIKCLNCQLRLKEKWNLSNIERCNVLILLPKSIHCFHVFGCIWKFAQRWINFLRIGPCSNHLNTGLVCYSNGPLPTGVGYSDGYRTYIRYLSSQSLTLFCRQNGWKFEQIWSK